ALGCVADPPGDRDRTLASIQRTRPTAGQSASNRAVEGAGLPQPAVQRPRSPLVGDDRVLDRLPDPALDVRRGAHALHQLERLVAVLLLGIRVDLEVLHAHTVVPVEALV